MATPYQENLKGRNLRETIYSIIAANWPIHASDIARELNISLEGDNQKRQLSKISYHLNKLVEENRIKSRKIDRALVVWPCEIEKLRLIHELVS